ncbi:MAG: DnaB-like helicase C-terminal domain-containing protein, partial [Armatimonadota bacterium]
YKEPGQIPGIPTGLSRLDERTQGLRDSELIIVAGRPSMGKTSLAVNNFCVNCAVREKRSVGIFSLEMSKMQLTETMLCSLAKVNSHRLRQGLGNPNDWQRLGNALGVLPNARIYIDDTPGLPIMELRSKARWLKSQEDIDLIVIDYLQLIGGDGASSYDSRHQEISAIARSLKEMARQLNIPVVALSQLSRQVERRVQKRPILSDLAESGSLEAEADLVMLLYRPSYYRQKEAEKAAAEAGETTPEEIAKMKEAPDDAEIIVAKHRTGPTGTVEVKFDQKYRIFADIDTFRE